MNGNPNLVDFTGSAELEDAVAMRQFRDSLVNGITVTQFDSPGSTDYFIFANYFYLDCPPTPTPNTPTAGVGEDPHFKTWSGSFYDYMGACDLVLLHAPSFDRRNDQALDIVIRTKIRHDYSYIESAAIKIGEEVLEVSSFGEYVLNGVSYAELPNNLSGYSVNHTQVDKKVHDFVIDLGSGEEIAVRTFKDWVSVKLEKPSKERFQDSNGMMGEFATGKLLGRDGVTIIEDPNALAAEWQVRQDEPRLFHSASSLRHPEPCKLPTSDTSAIEMHRILGEQSIAYETAAEACKKSGTENQEGCVHDVITTGDLDLAAAMAI